METENNLTKSLVAIFETHSETELAVQKLQQQGFEMKNLSIIALNLNAVEYLKGYENVLDRMKKWGGIGAFYGGFWGLLFAASTHFVPGIGPLLIAGPISAVVIAAASAFALGTVSALGAALMSLGIPERHILKYETEIKAGKYLLLAHGNIAQIEQAREVLHVHVPKEYEHENDWQLFANSATTILRDDVLSTED